MSRVMVIGSWVWIALAAGWAAAQPPPFQPGPPAAGTPMPVGAAPVAAQPGAIVESKLGPIYVRDQGGSLVVFPSIRLEELDKLMQLKQQQRMIEPPRYTFGAGTLLTGSAGESAANLELKIQVQRQKQAVPQEEWVRIPLRMNQAVLVPPVEHDGTGEFLLVFDPTGDGYVLWLRATSGSGHHFTIRFKVPLLMKNGARQLVLKTPDTPTSLRLSGVGSGAEPRVNAIAGNILTSRRDASGQIELVVDSAGGEIDLSWRELAELPPVLAALGHISVALDGRQLTFDAQLTVRSYGPPIDTFIVRLPVGTELIGTNQFTQPGLEYSPVSTPDEKSAGRQFLVRRTEGKTSGPIEARLRCETSGDPRNSSNPWQLGGFEVVGARHQKGTIDVHVEGDWSIEWKPDANVRRVDDPPDGLRQQKLVARFEYDRQPFSLLGKIQERQTRVTVEPSWFVSVAADRISLDGTLKFRMTGAKPKPLVFETNGWKIEQITPSELVAGDWQTDATTASVPISAAVQSRGGEFELQIQATRDHLPAGVAAAAAARTPRGLYGLSLCGNALLPLGPASQLLLHYRGQSGDISFRLPRPVTDAGLPALAIIAPADNIELVPTVDRLRSLLTDTLPPELTLPPRQQQPLVYREEAGGQAAEFVGQFRVRPQSIAVSGECRFRVEERETIVDQRFSFAISYEPTSVLRFEVPRSLVDSGRFELLVDGVASSWSRQPPTLVSQTSHLPILVELRDPRIGSCQAVFRFRMPHEVPRPESSRSQEPTELVVPLVRIPIDDATSMTSHRLRIAEAATLSVVPEEESWIPADEEFADVTSGWSVYETEESPAEVRLSVALESTPTRRTTELLRLWVQSTLTTEERRDRACFRLTTNEQSLTFQLPPGAARSPADVMVAVNGQRTNRFAVSPPGRLRVELGEVIGIRETTIEIWYWFPAHQVFFGRVLLQAPIPVGVTRAERAYWELLLPGNEYLAWNSSDLTSENGWEQRQLLRSRRPLRSSSDLEKWISASHQPDLAGTSPGGFNSYLFSSLGTFGPKTVYTVTRPLAVLVVAGAVFACGVMLMYRPALRHPLTLLAAGVTLVGVSVAYPEPAAAAAQLSLIGILLVLITSLFKALLVRPGSQQSGWRPASPQPDSRSLNIPSSRSMVVNSQVTTTSLPAQVAATGIQP